MAIVYFIMSYGRLSSKLYNICLPALISSILNIMDTVRTAKVCIIYYIPVWYCANAQDHTGHHVYLLHVLLPQHRE